LFDKDGIYYRGLKIDRASELRKDLSWVEKQWQNRGCRVLLLHSDRNLMVWDRQADLAPVAVSHSRFEVESILPELDDLVFLGFDDNIPLFAGRMCRRQKKADILDLPGEHEFVDLREAGWLLPGTGSRITGLCARTFILESSQWLLQSLWQFGRESSGWPYAALQ